MNCSGQLSDSKPSRPTDENFDIKRILGANQSMFIPDRKRHVSYRLEFNVQCASVAIFHIVVGTRSSFPVYYKWQIYIIIIFSIP